MTMFIRAIIVCFMLLPLAAAQRGRESTPNAPQSAAGSTHPKVMASSGTLKITSPTVGQKIGSSSVNVQYELTDRAADAASVPTYRLQLDSRAPVDTEDTSYDFTGLAPGSHVVTVELVDANQTPIMGSRTTVHFKTYLPGAASGSNGTGAGSANPSTMSSLFNPAAINARLPQDKNSAPQPLPAAGSELPLLSMLGFGVLVGGVISAIRTRRP